MAVLQKKSNWLVFWCLLLYRRYNNIGDFPALGYEVTDVPTHGFGTYEADLKQDIDNVKLGVSLVCDLGFRRSLLRTVSLPLRLSCRLNPSLARR